MTQLIEISPPVNEPRGLSRIAPSAALAQKLAWILGGMSAFGPLAIDMYLPAFPGIAKDFDTSISGYSFTLRRCSRGALFPARIAGDQRWLAMRQIRMTEPMCLAHLADPKINGAEQTCKVRADTLFDFCFGPPTRFCSKDATSKPPAKELREEAAKARIHKGYGRFPYEQLIKSNDL